MYYCEPCGDTLPEYEVIACDDQLGGVKDMILLECNHQISDPSNAVQVQAEIDAGRAILVKNIRLGVPAASPVLIDSKVSGQPQRLVRYDRTADYINGNVSPINVTFHNTLFSGRNLGGVILHEHENDTVTWINRLITVTGSKITPDSDADTIHFQGTLNWRARKDSVDGDIYDAPTGIFDAA